MMDQQQQCGPNENFFAFSTKLTSDDLLIEILSRLPVKALMRFKCVSVSWKTMILSPIFVAAHLAYAAARSNHLLLHSKVIAAEDIMHLFSKNDDEKAPIKLCSPFKFPEYLSVTAVAGCSNGLACLKTNNSALVLWNPATREHRSIPDPQILCSLDRKEYKVSCNFSFGFLPSLGDYKVIAMVLYRRRHFDPRERETLTRVEVFAKSTNTWREIVNKGALVLPGVILDREDKLMLNESLYWIGRDWDWWKDVSKFVLNKQFVITFDMREEKFRKIVVPHHPGLGKRKLSVLKGSLAMMVYSLNDNVINRYACDLWTMNHENESWSKLLFVATDITTLSEKGFWYNPYFVFKRRTDDDATDSREGNRYSCQLFPYFESLVSVQ